MDSSSSYERDDRIFIPVLLISQILGIGVVALTATLITISGGFAWTKALVFNYHPFFMILGLVFLYGEAILIYRSFTCIAVYPVKVVHGLLQLIALVFAIVALVAVFTSKNWKGYKNMYSFHSWLGICTVALFGLQWLIALFIYMLPFASNDARKWMMPIHRAMGLAIFVMAVGSVILGLTEQNQFSGKYSALGTQIVLSNCIAVCSVLFLAVVTYIITKRKWQRPSDGLPEEKQIFFRR